VWSVRGEHWQQFLAAMDSFYERERHARVPHTHVEGGYRLGHKINNMRRQYSAGRLAPERVRELELRYRMWIWDDLAERWRAFLAAMDGFYRREGHANVPRAHIESGYPLGAKVHNLRFAKRAGKLNRQRIPVIERRYRGWIWSRSRPASTRSGRRLTRRDA
jgi:hypothetical protein